MRAEEFLTNAATASPELQAKIVGLPSVMAEWLQPYGGFAGRRVMDFGCGVGETAAGIALTYDPEFVCGVEVTNAPESLPEMMREAVALETLPESLEFRRIAAGDICDDGDFDVVVSWSVFEHIHRGKLDHVIDLVRSRMKHGGLLFLQISPLYHSPEGSHLWALGYTNWEHLTRQISEVQDDLDAADLTDKQRAALWKMFSRLNRLTAPELLARLEARGFTLLRQQIDKVSQEPPAELLSAHQRDALKTHQVVLLLRRD